MNDTLSLEKLLSLLESVTEDSTKEKDEWDELEDMMNSEFKDLDRQVMYNIDFSSSPAKDKLIDRAAKVRYMHSLDIYRVVTYPNIQGDMNEYSLNVTELFDYVMKKINDHAANPKESFDSDKVIKEAISNAFQTCTGKSGGETMTIAEFKTRYREVVYGSTTKVQITPNMSKIASRGMKIPIILTYIDQKLIYRHISNMANYEKELLSKMKSVYKSHPDQYSNIIKYMKCATDAIQTTYKIYLAMYNIFYTLMDEYNRIFNIFIQRNNELESTNESAILKTAESVKPFFQKLKSASEQLNQILTESTDGAQDIEKISESLNASQFAQLNIDSVYCGIDSLQRKIDELQKAGGVVATLSKPADTFQILEYESINKIINFQNLFSKFDSNIKYLNEILEHSDKYNNLSIRSNLTKLLGNSLTYNPESEEPNNSYLGNVLRSYTSKMIGEKKIFHPDIGIISTNIVEIPIAMGTIISHIKQVAMLVNSNTSVQTFGDKPDINSVKMVIVIKNMIISYLAVLLNICWNLSTIGTSSLSAAKQLAELESED